MAAEYIGGYWLDHEIMTMFEEGKISAEDVMLLILVEAHTPNVDMERMAIYMEVPVGKVRAMIRRLKRMGLHTSSMGPKK